MGSVTQPFHYSKYLQFKMKTVPNSIAFFWLLPTIRSNERVNSRVFGKNDLMADEIELTDNPCIIFEN